MTTTAQTRCPSYRTWQRILAGSAAPVETLSFRHHLATCEACQLAYSELKSDGLEEQETETLGGYRLLEKIGEGGMGSVFLARDPVLGRRVAIKVISRDNEDGAVSGLNDAFLHEARALATVKDDHIVTMYHVGRERGRSFMVMEYLEGESLRDRLAREGALPISESLRIAREIAEGLRAVHSFGLVHRDVKPANIWLTPDRAKLIDFGLSRCQSQDASEADACPFSGTPQYMSPEQIEGETPDPRGDLFSLGCVLYEMLAGHPPFVGEGVLDTVMAIQLDDPPPLEEVRPDVPASVLGLVHRMLAKRVSERVTSALRVVHELSDLEFQAGRASKDTQVMSTPTLVFDRIDEGPTPPRPPVRIATLILAGVVSLVTALLAMGLVRLLTE